MHEVLNHLLDGRLGAMSQERATNSGNGKRSSIHGETRRFKFLHGLATVREVYSFKNAKLGRVRRDFLPCPSTNIP